MDQTVSSEVVQEIMLILWSPEFIIVLITTHQFGGCLTVHLPHEIKWNANLMQLGSFIDVSLARHISGTYAHRQEH